MDVKYFTIAIIGFVIGLSINLSVEISQFGQEYEPPAHVARWQHLMAFSEQDIDKPWATKQETQFQQAFLANQYLNLSYLKCYTDICAFDVEKDQDVSEQMLRRQLTLAVSAIESPILQGYKRVIVDGNSRHLILYQFAKAS